MMKMSKTSMLYVVVMCVLGMLLGMSSVQAGSMSIDEDFESGTIFTNLGGNLSSTSTAQGANIWIDPLSQTRGVPPAGDPVVFVNNPAASNIVNLNPAGTLNALMIKPGQSVQIGQIAGPTASKVNGNIPCWGDGNALVQAAMAVPPSVTGLAAGTVVGTFDIAFDARGVEGSPLYPSYPLRHQKFELRVNTSSAVDVWSIDTTETKVVAENALDGTNWANCTFVAFCRGLLVDNAAPLHKTWTPTTLGGTSDHKGPTSTTVMVTTEDMARVSVFVNGNDALTTYTYQSNADGRDDGGNNGIDNARIMGIKWTAGAATPLLIDNVFVGDSRWANVPVQHSSNPVTNTAWRWHSRLNHFTAPNQPVEPVAGVNNWWEIY